MIQSSAGCPEVGLEEIASEVPSLRCHRAATSPQRLGFRDTGIMANTVVGVFPFKTGEDMAQAVHHSLPK